MSEHTFLTLFPIVWVAAMAYAMSVLRLALRLKHLKAEGKTGDAPTSLQAFDGLRFLKWLLTGRFAEIDDDIVQRWALIARVLFFVALPMILGMFVVLATNMGSWNQPT